MSTKKRKLCELSHRVYNLKDDLFDQINDHVDEMMNDKDVNMGICKSIKEPILWRNASITYFDLLVSFFCIRQITSIDFAYSYDTNVVHINHVNGMNKPTRSRVCLHIDEFIQSKKINVYGFKVYGNLNWTIRYIFELLSNSYIFKDNIVGKFDGIGIGSTVSEWKEFIHRNVDVMDQRFTNLAYRTSILSQMDKKKVNTTWFVTTSRITMNPFLFHIMTNIISLRRKTRLMRRLRTFARIVGKFLRFVRWKLLKSTAKRQEKLVQFLSCNVVS